MNTGYASDLISESDIHSDNSRWIAHSVRCKARFPNYYQIVLVLNPVDHRRSLLRMRLVELDPDFVLNPVLVLSVAAVIVEQIVVDVIVAVVIASCCVVVELVVVGYAAYVAVVCIVVIVEVFVTVVDGAVMLREALSVEVVDGL